jgi:hypothetical protein
LEKREVYPIAMYFAKSAVANALVDGYKSVELCQAYFLLSIYAVPARRWGEDHSWLYTGLAILYAHLFKIHHEVLNSNVVPNVRIATDLNLHLLPPKTATTEQQQLEMLNRTQIWTVCFNVDESAAVQFGKQSILREDQCVPFSYPSLSAC